MRYYLIIKLNKKRFFKNLFALLNFLQILCLGGNPFTFFSQPFQVSTNDARVAMCSNLGFNFFGLFAEMQARCFAQPSFRNIQVFTMEAEA